MLDTMLAKVTYTNSGYCVINQCSVQRVLCGKVCFQSKTSVTSHHNTAKIHVGPAQTYVPRKSLV